MPIDSRANIVAAARWAMAHKTGKYIWHYNEVPKGSLILLRKK